MVIEIRDSKMQTENQNIRNSSGTIRCDYMRQILGRQFIKVLREFQVGHCTVLTVAMTLPVVINQGNIADNVQRPA